MDPSSPASLLTQRRASRFGELHDDVVDHIAGHGCRVGALGPVAAREFEVLVRATHSTYVLELNAGLGEATLHMAGSFGRTGKLHTIEADPSHANFIETQVRRFALQETVRVNIAPPANVISALSGPYDLVVIHDVGHSMDAKYEDVVRLLRTGGSLAIQRRDEALQLDAAEGGFLDRLATDPRMLPWFAPDMSRVLATRIR